MQAALERLGYRHCAHGFDMLDDPAYVTRWEQAVDAKYFKRGKSFRKADWDELLGHCAAVTDMPCVLFWRELCEAYPEAKVIISQRDEDRWFKSFDEGVLNSTLINRDVHQEFRRAIIGLASRRLILEGRSSSL